ncbi:MAG: type II toxin-antitoxin system RelE family toxin [Thermoplasmata archaeon]
MTRIVLLSGPADRTYRTLPKAIQRRVHDALFEFASSGHGDLKRLHGTKGRDDLLRLRVGDYRVVLALTNTEVRVTRILHRSEGYDWL